MNIKKCNNKRKRYAFLVSIVVVKKVPLKKKIKTMKLFKFCSKITFDCSKFFFAVLCKYIFLSIITDLIKNITFSFQIFLYK